MARGSRLAAEAPTGKDVYHPSAQGAIAARRLAKAVVLTGAAQECWATLAFGPGQPEAQIVSLMGDAGLLDASRWAGLLDRTLAGIGDRYTNRADLVEVVRATGISRWRSGRGNGCSSIYINQRPIRGPRDRVRDGTIFELFEDRPASCRLARVQ